MNIGPRFRCCNPDCGRTFRCDSLPDGPEGCIECGGRQFAEVPAPPAKPLACPHCDEGESVSADGSSHYACHSCLGSSLLRCDACGELGAVHEDQGTALCGPCLAEVNAAEARDRAVVALSALLLRAFGMMKLGLVPQSRPCTPPPPPAFQPAMPPLARRDPSSATWRAMRETSIATVRPGGSL
jgi:hypothetical protein